MESACCYAWAARRFLDFAQILTYLHVLTEARLPALQLAAGLVEKLFLNATLGTGMALLEADDKHSKLSLMAPGNDAERYPPASSQRSN